MFSADRSCQIVSVPTHRVARRTARALVWLLAFWLGASGTARAGSGVDKRQVEAALLLSFAHYVNWPADSFDSPGDPIIIGVYGDRKLKAAADERAQGRPVRGRQIQIDRLSSLEQARDCHILFVGRSKAKDPQAIATALAGAHVFSVSETTDFARQGGVANFVMVGNQVRLAVSERAARAAGLRLNPALLKASILVD